jgi:hypothetical protein
MNNYLSLIILILFVSCVGSDTTFLPDSIREAKEQKILINTYKPSLNEITINKEKYTIKDCFTSFKFISTTNKNLNEKFFAFIFKLKNVKTGAEFEFENENSNFYDYINFYSKNGGIHESNLSIYYEDLDLIDKLDTIKIGFKDNLKNEQIVFFIKDN